MVLLVASDDGFVYHPSIPYMATNFSRTAAYMLVPRRSAPGRLQTIPVRSCDPAVHHPAPPGLRAGGAQTQSPRTGHKAESDDGARRGGAREVLAQGRRSVLLQHVTIDLSKLGSADIKSNLITYVDSFSSDAREIFEQGQTPASTRRRLSVPPSREARKRNGSRKSSSA